MNRIHMVIKKLTEVSEDEWKVAIARCKKLIDHRTKGKTIFGAHCESRLGMDPFDFYFQRALDSLYEGVWNWQFEKYTLSEQLTRIIGSMISEEVRKYKGKKEKEDSPSFISYEEYSYRVMVGSEEDIPSEEYEKKCDKQLKIIEQAITGDEDMENLFLLILDGKTNNDICENLGWDKRKLYKVSEKMKNRALQLIKQQ